MNKKILFFSPYAIWPFHFENDLEIIKQHIDQGDEVTFLTCDGDLSSCEPNSNHNLSTCQSCIQRRNKGFQLLEISNKVKFLNFVNLSNSDRQTIKNFPKYFKNLRTLKLLTLENFDIGLSVASSLISYLREPYPNPNNYKDYVKRNIESALIVYLSVKNHIQAIKPDKMYIFNGRFASLRAAMRAAQQMSTSFDIHERAEVGGKYSLTANTYPHDRQRAKAKIESVWTNSSLPEAEKFEIGSQWFIDRRMGKDQGWVSFTSDQNKAPNFIDKSKTNIVIYNSSEDEFTAIAGWENHIYKSQTEGLFRLAQSLKNDQNIDIYLRVHPNLKNISNSQTKALTKLKGRYANFHIISAEDTINSYELMDIADCIITFGSTMGVESAFYHKHSFLVGASFYEDLEVCSTISSHNELVNIIKDRQFDLSLLVKEERKKNAIKYGFFMATYGVDFIHFKQKSVFVMTLSHNGKTINDSLIYSRILAKFKRIIVLGLFSWKTWFKIIERLIAWAVKAPKF